MSSGPLRSSESSARSSLSDIAAITSPTVRETVPLANGESHSDSLDMSPRESDDLDVEDPLTRIYPRNEFEPFSRTEIGFIGVTCIGVIAVPAAFFVVNLVEVIVSGA